jgi:hypothetical protein
MVLYLTTGRGRSISEGAGFATWPAGLASH